MAITPADQDAELPSSPPRPRPDPQKSLLHNPPTRRKNPQEVLAATPFSTAYRSTFVLTEPSREVLPLLKHVNCSYLSTPGIAPSLAQLKQHAQSLAILIKHLTVSTAPGLVDNQNAGISGAAFVEGESFDWLNDLTSEYQGPKNPGVARHHDLPLTSIMNTLEQYNALIPGRAPTTNHRDRCPLYHSEKAPVNGPSLPYATHQALIAHANEALELLDHEYGAKGGLLSILPAESEKEDRKKAESTLLGQLILYLQRLVERLHDLERQYANAMDVLAGESNVPHQALSLLGPDGRKGREMVYPQDRFVLVNAGDDVWGFLDKEFEKKERVDEAVAANYKRDGVLGERMWEERGGREMSRGITALDITTRYYRLRKDPLKTIFVIPAHQEHPGVKVTREMEAQPTVVSVAKPAWPERASLWEMQHRADLEDLKRLKRENAELRQQVEWMEDERSLLDFENKKKDGEVRLWTGKMKELETVLRGDVHAERLQVWEQMNGMQAQKQEAQGYLDEAKKEKEESAKRKQRIDEGWAELEKARAAFGIEMSTKRRIDAETLRKRTEAIERLDEDSAAAALELEAKMKEVWTRQIKETQVVVEWLRRKKVDVTGDVVTEDVEMAGRSEGERLAARAAEGQLRGGSAAGLSAA